MLLGTNPFSLFPFKELTDLRLKRYSKKDIIKLTYSTEILTHITKVYMPVGNQEWPLNLNQF